MSNFEVKVRCIDAVEDHPDADRLSICTILGYRAITGKVPQKILTAPDDATVETHPRMLHLASPLFAG